MQIDNADIRIIDIKKVIDLSSGKILEYVEEGKYKDDLIERYSNHFLLKEICTNGNGDVLIYFHKLP